MALSPKLPRLLLWVILLISIDQLSKNLVTQHFLNWQDGADSTLYLGRREPLIETAETNRIGFYLGLSYVRNMGALGGFMKDLPVSWKSFLLIGLGFLGSVLLGIIFFQAPPQATFVRHGSLLIVAGALGNTLDRLLHGYVIDFIGLRAWAFGPVLKMPYFNVADIFLVIGGLLLIVGCVHYPSFEASRG